MATLSLKAVLLALFVRFIFMTNVIEAEVEEMLPNCHNREWESLDVEYDLKAISCGDELKLDDLRHPNRSPSAIRYKYTKEDRFYTLLMVGTNEPSGSNPIEKYFLNWLVVNIEGSDLADDASNFVGQNLIGYGGLRTLLQSGHHQCMFFFFEHEVQKEIEIETERGDFDVKGFVKRFDLNDPVAFTMFTIEEE